MKHLLIIFILFTCCKSTDRIPIRIITVDTISLDTISLDSIRRTVITTWESERAMHEYYKQLDLQLQQSPYPINTGKVKSVDKSRTYIYTNSRNKGSVVASTDSKVNRNTRGTDNAGEGLTVAKKAQTETKNVQGNYVEERAPAATGLSFNLPWYAWVIIAVVVIGAVYLFITKKSNR